MNAPSDIDRRHFLRDGGLSGVAVLAAACAPAPAPAPAPAASSAQPAAPAAPQTPAWQQEWEKLVAAAKQEGALALLTLPAAGYRDGIRAFEEAFPGIRVDHTSMSPSNFTAKLKQERDAGVYTYDIGANQFGVTGFQWIAEGSLDPLRPLLFRPDVLSDDAWRGGYEAGYLDAKKQYGYSSMWSKQRPFWINTGAVAPDEIKSLDDLLNPKWKGKIIAGDPRTLGGGKFITVLRRAKGDDFARKLYKDQETVLSRDLRQLAEGMFRDRYAIGIEAMNDGVIQEFFTQGLGKNLKTLDFEGINYVLTSSGVLFYFNRAPHPNAARLFANWVLSKEGATIWGKASSLNSRRADVPTAFPDVQPLSGKKYLNLDYETDSAETIQSQEVAKQLIG